jgi:DNA-binding MarR family transcriptional regulator
LKNNEKIVPLDHESRLVEDDHHSIRLWLRLLACTNMIEAALRTRLRESFGTTLPRFDFMAQLAKVSEGLTMGELSKQMMVSGGNVSGIASQLESEGLIDRAPMPNNRRTFCVKLTEEGKQRFSEMAEAHEQWVIELLGHLSSDDQQRLMATLRRVKLGIADSLD